MQQSQPKLAGGEDLFSPLQLLTDTSLPQSLRGELEALNAASQVLSLAACLFSYCSTQPPKKREWANCRGFLRGVVTLEGVRTVNELAKAVPEALEKGKLTPFGSDRFCKKVAWDQSLKVRNAYWGLYLAAVARAFPDLSRCLKIDTEAARIVRDHDWNPLQPTKQI